MDFFRELTDRAQGVRRLGAASVDLCHVASGETDGSVPPIARSDTCAPLGVFGTDRTKPHIGSIQSDGSVALRMPSFLHSSLFARHRRGILGVPVEAMGYLCRGRGPDRGGRTRDYHGWEAVQVDRRVDHDPYPK